MGEGKTDCCQTAKVCRDQKRCVSLGSHSGCVGKLSWQEGQFCKDTVGGREAGFVFKSEDLYFVSEELCCSCSGFCVLVKQLWRLKPLYACGFSPPAGALASSALLASSEAPARLPVSSLSSHLHPQWSLFLIFPAAETHGNHC